jgi:hypothetical protein
MKRRVSLILTSVILLGCCSLYAGEIMLSEPSYLATIDNRIERCLRKSSQMSSTSERIRQSAEMAMAEAVYYQAKREELAKGMAEQGIACKPYKVDHYLIQSFAGSSVDRPLASTEKVR